MWPLVCESGAHWHEISGPNLARGALTARGGAASGVSDACRPSWCVASSVRAVSPRDTSATRVSHSPRPENRSSTRRTRARASGSAISCEPRDFDTNSRSWFEDEHPPRPLEQARKICQGRCSCVTWEGSSHTARARRVATLWHPARHNISRRLARAPIDARRKPCPFANRVNTQQGRRTSAPGAATLAVAWTA